MSEEMSKKVSEIWNTAVNKWIRDIEFDLDFIDANLEECMASEPTEKYSTNSKKIYHLNILDQKLK